MVKLLIVISMVSSIALIMSMVESATAPKTNFVVRSYEKVTKKFCDCLKVGRKTSEKRGLRDYIKPCVPGKAFNQEISTVTNDAHHLAGAWLAYCQVWWVNITTFALENQVLHNFIIAYCTMFSSANEIKFMLNIRCCYLSEKSYQQWEEMSFKS